MSEKPDRPSLLAHADQIALQISGWSVQKQHFARRSTSAVVMPFPNSIDVGPLRPREADAIIIDDSIDGISKK